MESHLVTVICVCYNHAAFVEEALNSVINQSYSKIELIVIDDGSLDGSSKVIKKWMANHPDATLILNGKNLGYCTTFNKAYRIAKGEFVIDLAADDVLLPNRVDEGIRTFEKIGPEYGVIFSDAQYMDEQGKSRSLHSNRFPHDSIPQGDIYKELIRRYFICSPTMMVRKEVLDQLHGYDESLAFEDFDFWIRASRDFKFFYSPEVLVKKRIVPTSMSAKQFKRSSPQRLSTLSVCRKIKVLNRTQEEDNALRMRLWYEIRVSIRSFDFRLAYQFWKLLVSI